MNGVSPHSAHHAMCALTRKTASGFTAESEFIQSKHDLAECGIWHFLTKQLEYEDCPSSIWHQTKPLNKFLNESSSLIIASLLSGVRRWLDPWSMEPLRVSDVLTFVS